MKGSVKEMIGNTPLLELKSQSEKCGSKILIKCENLNPGGSFVDRIWLENAQNRKNQSEENLECALNKLTGEIQSQNLEKIDGYIGIGGLNFLDSDCHVYVQNDKNVMIYDKLLF